MEWFWIWMIRRSGAFGYFKRTRDERCVPGCASNWGTHVIDARVGEVSLFVFGLHSRALKWTSIRRA